jgi:hypothetical protein
MLLLLPVLIALVVSVLTGGSLRHLATLRVRGVGLILSSLALQVALSLPPLSTWAPVLRWNGALYLCAFALAGAGALRNWRLGTAARVAICGVLLNAVVVVANGGQMPVNAAAMQFAAGQGKVRQIAAGRSFNNTRVANRSSRLMLFTDIIPVHVFGSLGNVYSVGDVLLCGGLAALAYGAARRPSSPTPA